MGSTHIGDNHNPARRLFFDSNEGVAVGDTGLILHTTDAGVGWQSVAGGVTDDLRSVSFSGYSARLKTRNEFAARPINFEALKIFNFLSS
jgi:hypothetical protein